MPPARSVEAQLEKVLNDASAELFRAAAEFRVLRQAAAGDLGALSVAAIKAARAKKKAAKAGKRKKK